MMKLNKNPRSWLVFVMLAFFLLFSGTIYAENKKILTPYDFYQGVELKESSHNIPFAWVELPVEAYVNSAYPKTLQDVRVFNGTGQEVPSALFYDSEESSQTSPIRFSLQPLMTREEQLNLKEETEDDKQYLLVETIPNKLTRLELPSMQQSKDTRYQAYLLTRQQDQQALFPAQTLNLEWGKSDQDWQGKAFIYASDDKQHWVNISAYQPVMNLSSDAGVIQNNTIELLKGNDSALSAPYLMVIIVTTKDTTLPELKTVQGIGKTFHATRQQEICRFITQNEGVSLNQLIYRLPSPQPLSSIVIQLQQTNRVIPLQIEYASNSGENWLPLTNMVAYHQVNNGEQTRNPEIALNDLMIKKLRITALKGSWDDKPPYIEGKRDAVNLVFNVQGASPYLLVWGSHLASMDGLNYQELIGQSLTVEQLMHNYPELSLAKEVIELGGEEQLTINGSEGNNFDWMILVIWLLLGIGIIALLYFCWYLLREINTKSTKK
ncbi:DUF3999 family protein [Providencia vermicola]|uniref:DUF3999 domain-containing protein n=2 Tax=Morganellaceae TaxID=1903414 RepID=A0AAX3RS53_9GAMM|nr:MULTISPECIES: DUF3999 family protein [Providencia]MCK1145128.1 DUF3999 domain-containing protein [Providencia stuartii]USB36551.1 DUF3999 domain-containing protein [Providencia vermicola]WER20936.1 DUF3999 family protein [Providencia stuartii]WER25056.1 DUF3999 family protein [Providencia stuartii]WER29146.1 DUF3999 family protein [Providencia stuartii]